MEGKFKLIVLVVLVFCTNRAQSNIILNNDFSNPTVTISQSYPFSIPYWNCTNTCEIFKCSIMAWNCSGQAIDVSSSFIEVISQDFSAISGTYNFSFQFLLPKNNAHLKVLQVYVNGVFLYSHSPSVNTDNLSYTFDTSVSLNEGVNNIYFTQSGQSDAQGFKISLVSMSLISPTVSPILTLDQNVSIPQYVQQILKNNVTTGTVSFPASRILLGQLVGLFVSFDRLQLYYYHNRNYSLEMESFMSAISSLLDQKGSLSASFQKQMFENVAQEQKTFINSLDYKQGYTDLIIANKSLNGYGFISNNVNLVVYSVPWFLLITAFFYLLFRITFNFKLSKVFRKYSFGVSVFLLMVCEGNIQQFSFYAFGEFTTFFSANFQHKIVNCAILFFFMVVVFCSFAFYFWFWSLSKYKASYFTENVRLKVGGVFSYTVDRGVICFFFGAVHQLLLYFPNAQLLALSLCEVAWIVSQVICLRCEVYKCSLLVWLNIIEGFLRISLQLMCFLYSANDNSLELLSLYSLIHSNQMNAFFMIWIAEFVVFLSIFLKDLFSFFFQEKSDCSKEDKILRKAQYPRQLQLEKIRKRKQKQISQWISRQVKRQSTNFRLVVKDGKVKSLFAKKQKH